ncbi:MAG: 1-acyl-sn-glycerol-3-phosphate acyltransferase [Acidobacteria bacterium]|nr:1-acyl-sn-glycerol-3-phosphate acyltransferase [Acidobacteriota bacterium]
MQNFLKILGLPIFKILFAVEYHGLDNIPKQGAVILAGNHPSYLDPILVALPIKRTIRYMAWDALFKIPVLGWLIKSLGAFPVDITRGKGESAFLEACKVLNNGYALGIFPEGQRSEQGPMGELRSGTVRLALETGAVIVPITIGGASRAWPKWKLLPKPAKVIVRYHKPISISPADRETHRSDKEFQQKIMGEMAKRINRSLTPALHGDQSYERWYRQPPSNIRIYEWAPLIAALVATSITFFRHTLADNLHHLWIPPLVYYLYLAADLQFIKPSRESKWLRNSMPIWLVAIWHTFLTHALLLPVGDQNGLFFGVTVAAFFAFFWEDYFTLQKFVRGLVLVYYLALAMLLRWPHPLGVGVAIASFIIAFSLWYRTIYYWATVAVVGLGLAFALWMTTKISPVLLVFSALGGAAIGYLQTFINAAYDIRKAGQIAAK